MVPLLYARTMRKRSQSKVVVAYLRVSTQEQAVSGLGLADQREVIAREAERRGWDAVEYITDDGYSAKSLARPGISDALARLRAGDAGILVVSKLDRLSRSVHDFTGLIATAKREGWELVVLDLALDTSTPNGKFMASVLASVSELERDLISARTSAAMQQLKAQGKRLGRPRTMPTEVTERIVSERAEGPDPRGNRRGSERRRRADCSGRYTVVSLNRQGSSSIG